MTWDEVREKVKRLMKKNEEVCKHAPSRRQFAENYLETSLRAITSDCVGMPYGKNQEKFNNCRFSITTTDRELKVTPPTEFNSGRTKNTEYALNSWEAWLDSLPEKKSIWEKIHLVFTGR